MQPKLLQKTIMVFLILLLLSIALGPMYWTFITSFKPSSVTWGKGLGSLSITSFTLENYRKILIYNPFWESYVGPNIVRPLVNSFVVAIVVTAVALIVGSLGAYGLAMFRIPGGGIISAYMLLAYVFPPFILIVPLSIYLGRLGLLDSLVGVGVSHLIISVPFVAWMLKGYFMGINRDVVGAALVDGCSKIGVLIKIILPISAPGVITAAIFAFTRSWSEFLFALIILNSRAKYTLPVAATALKVTDIVRWGELMGVAVLAALPPVVLYMVIQKYIVQGLMAGAIKG